jgi:hypothetical protein
MVFVDGLGIGRADPAVNPITPESAPTLHALLDASIRLDAMLGVPGFPQSATGQTALLTGVNAARLIRRHLEGFPNAELRELVAASNVFKRLSETGIACTFANAYLAANVDEVRQRRRHSVTTVAALSGLGTVRCRDFLERNEAVCHDLTRETLAARGYTGPTITPEAAAGHLAAISASHGFTLFEHFLTDRAGHGMSLSGATKVIRVLDRFLTALLPACAAAGVTVLLTSDHGNIEDLSVPGHTMNPVPLSVTPAATAPNSAADLCDVTPFVISFLVPSAPSLNSSPNGAMTGSR